MRIGLVIGVALGHVMCASASAAQTPDGQALYQQNCRACHGPNGVAPERLRAVYKTLPTLDSAFVAARSDDSLVAIVQNGAGNVMKGFKDRLSKDQMLAIVRYLRSFTGTPAKTP